MKQCISSNNEMETSVHLKIGANPKNQKSRVILTSGIIILIFVCGFVINSCEKGESNEATATSKSEEIIKNPWVADAVNKSGISIHKGENPPQVTGLYAANGKVLKASLKFNSYIGDILESTFELHNQTASGSISYQERLENIKISGMGGYISGDNGKFTIYLESTQSGKDAGLPNGVSLKVVVLMSGTKASNGNITASLLTIYTDVISTISQFDTNGLVGSWFFSEGNFTLKSGN